MTPKFNFAAKLHIAAKDSNLKLRFVVSGPPGAGKTFTLLVTAFALLAGKENPRVLVADTENRSASKYADLFPAFDVIELDDDQGPQCMTALIEYAEAEGYDVLIIDSLSHEWNGKNGVLEQVDQIAARTHNTTEAWRQITPIHDALFRKIQHSKIHILAGLRSKQQMTVEIANGRATPRRLGMLPIMRDGVEYEFDVSGRMETDGNVLIIEKSRCSALAGKMFRQHGPDIGHTLSKRLRSDEAKTPKATGTVPTTGAPGTKTTGTAPSREKMLAEFTTLIGVREKAANDVLVNAKVPYISVGQTYRNLTDEQLIKVLAHKDEFLVKMNAVPQSQQQQAA